MRATPLAGNATAAAASSWPPAASAAASASASAASAAAARCDVKAAAAPTSASCRRHRQASASSSTLLRPATSSCRSGAAQRSRKDATSLPASRVQPPSCKLLRKHETLRVSWVQSRIGLRAEQDALPLAPLAPLAVADTHRGACTAPYAGCRARAGCWLWSLRLCRCLHADTCILCLRSFCCSVAYTYTSWLQPCSARKEVICSGSGVHRYVPSLQNPPTTPVQTTARAHHSAITSPQRLSTTE